MTGLDDRVAELLAKFDGSARTVVDLLCDGYDPAALAYRVVRADFGCRDLTYGELRAESASLAAGLATLGIGKGDRVASLMGKSPIPAGDDHGGLAARGRLRPPVHGICPAGDRVTAQRQRGQMPSSVTALRRRNFSPAPISPPDRRG